MIGDLDDTGLSIDEIVFRMKEHTERHKGKVNAPVSISGIKRLVDHIEAVEKLLKPVAKQSRYRTKRGINWSKWSGWRNGPGQPSRDNIEYQERQLYVIDSGD